MGLIKAALGSINGVLADQWKENFICDSLSPDVLVAKGHRQQSRHDRSSNTSAENIITNGSTIVVNNGQCAIIVDQGKVAEIAAEPGQYTYDANSEPSIFTDGAGLSEKIMLVFEQIGKRFAYGGAPGKDQRIYYFNTKEITGNKYGTPSPIPFRVVDRNIGLDVDISIRCFGEYSYKIVNPILFYTNVCGNVEEEFNRSQIDSQLKTELLTALQPAFAKISELQIRPNALPAHTMEIAEVLNQVLDIKWSEKRGIEVVEFGISNVNISDEDAQMIKDLQRTGALRTPDMAAANWIASNAEAQKQAASNSAGAMTGFMGMGMLNGMAGGSNVNSMFDMLGRSQQNNSQPSAPSSQPSNSWTCSCGHSGNTGKFCAECGKPKPAPAGEWTCECGAKNKGKFCAECGKPKPASDEWTCNECGHEGNKGKFCAECGKPKVNVEK
ncbi:MAG: SPFH domain-containing protein [Selenomonadaceae bacterium]|nr:SPFH domain-containing protein [Selenomonadaceae bacterium]MBR1728797.1 SPFH domain-containing protein [Selenomonadaceae bacterium]